MEIGNAGCGVGDNYLPADARVYAVRIFNRALTKAEMDAEWALMRGRFGLEQRGDADGAAVAFARALALPLPPRLREDASARRAEALAQGGHAEEARDAAEAYLAAFPSGRHADRVRALLGAE